MRPTTRPSRHAQEQLRVAVLEERVLAAAEEQPALDAQRGDPVRRGRVQPVRELDELAQLLAARHGPHVHGHGGAPYMPETSIDVFAKARDNERVAQLRAAREADILPYFRTVEGPARPVVEMEGAARIMLGSNNYLGLTGDERVIQGARDALDALRHRPDRLAPAQRHDGAAPRARGRDRRLDGHRGRDRLHHRPPGQRRHAGDDPRPRRHGRRRLRRPRLDPRRLPAQPGQAARLPPQPHGQARAHARARGRRRRRRPRRRRRRLLDGGRRRRRCPRSATCASASARG